MLHTVEEIRHQRAETGRRPRLDETDTSIVDDGTQRRSIGRDVLRRGCRSDDEIRRRARRGAVQHGPASESSYADQATTSPATQPSSAAPAQTRIGYRSITAISSALPAMISGTLVARPKMIKVVLIASACAMSTRIAARFGRRGDRDDVVEAHDDVGDGDEPHRTQQRVARLHAVLAVLLARHDQLDRDPEQQNAADQLEERDQHDLGDDDGEDDAQQHAAPAPSRMPQKRCLGGSERQASAITTALSPDSRMLIQMIWPTATQNAHCSMSVQRYST